MTWLEAAILALIQGLTEFLPISSSAHLILPSQLLGWEDQGLAFDVAVHVGTLAAILLYFRREVSAMTIAWCRHAVGGPRSEDATLAWFIIFATVPAGLAGVLLGDWIEANLRSTLVIATTTVVFALLLWYADKRQHANKALVDMTIQAALVIGLAQALALIPGTSRSGITMTAALLLGFSRDGSARFSFLLSIPLIAAAGLLKGVELAEVGSSQGIELILLGTVISFVSALLCIHWFLKLLQRIGFMPFIIYRLALGALLFGLVLVS